MKTITKVKNLKVNFNFNYSTPMEAEIEVAEDSEKMELLVTTLRNIALDKFFEDKTIIIPEGCEKNGFVKGEYNLPKMLYFIADMLE
jgi:1-aminocyclopropane-1-carboxylate deaminase/D-cysteine desulfhydrase-like pyridoxal-dependent ACC family enzyme